MSAQESPHYWLGALSTTVGIAAQTVTQKPTAAQKDLQACLREFLASPVPSDELRAILRQYVK